MNADEYVSTEQGILGSNMFLYCENNPVVRKDTGGKLWITAGTMLIGGIVGGAISTVASIATQKYFTGEVNWKSVAVDAVSGFVGGAVAASPLGLTGQIVAGGVIGGASYGVDCKVNNKEIDSADMVASVIGGAVAGYIGGSGANEYKTLTKTVNTINKTIAKETRRARYKYSSKIIKSTVSWGLSRLEWVLFSSSAKFSAGLVVSKSIIMGNNWLRNRLKKCSP